MTSLASNAHPKVDEPIRLHGKLLRSRVYLPAHQPGLADDGLPGDRYVEYHRRRAAAGLGMQITGATPVLWSEVWAGGLTLVNIDDRIVPGYRRLAAAVHAEGGLMLAQLVHVGAMETTGDAIISASWTRSEITQQTSREATPDELAEIAELYRAAALRCRAGDLDGVEVTMAHGMLLASFLSPLMNRRTDRYGGALDGRTLYPREVVKRGSIRDGTRRDRWNPHPRRRTRPGRHRPGGSDGPRRASRAVRRGRLCQRDHGQQHAKARPRRSLAADARAACGLSASVAPREGGRAGSRRDGRPCDHARIGRGHSSLRRRRPHRHGAGEYRRPRASAQVEGRPGGERSSLRWRERLHQQSTGPQAPHLHGEPRRWPARGAHRRGLGRWPRGRGGRRRTRRARSRSPAGYWRLAYDLDGARGAPRRTDCTLVADAFAKSNFFSL